MFKRLILSLFTLMLSFDLMAAAMDIGLSDESARFRYTTPMGGTTLGRAEVVAGFLYNDDDKYMVEVGVLVIDVAGTKAPGLELGVGPKLYYVDTDIGSSGAMGIGGTMRYKMRELPRYFVSGEAFIAPSVVSFGDAETIIEFGMNANYELLPTADVYVGYHHIRVEFDSGWQSVDETISFGLKFRF